jgi:DNA-binding response OmpR family regulator
MASILVVDNEADVRHFLRSVLEGAGHEVLEASNGKEAMDEIHRRTFDLVLITLFVPVQEGLETIRELKEQHTGVPIIAMSDRFRDLPQEALQLMSVALGAKASMKKPLSADVVLEAVKKVLPSE